MGLRAFLLVYVVGGLTFIPLLIAAIFIPAWYLQPRVRPEENAREAAEGGEEKNSEEIGKEGNGRGISDPRDAAANGTFAVLRRYDFQAAIAAINARNTANGATSTDRDAPNDGTSSSTNESVYQSMYRSVFVGNKNNNSTATLLEEGKDQENTGILRKPIAANVLYIVLRHGHLMLYDSPAQVEVKHVISLAHHKVTLQAGNDGELEAAEPDILESDLFIKRTAIVLTPTQMPNGVLQASSSAARPFYLFTTASFEKEDFYHALLACRAQSPTPRPLDADALIKLQSALHSSSLTAETRALNAILGRVFLALHRTEVLSDLIRGKIEKKLSRIQKPTFIPSLRLRSIDLGDAGPVVSNLKLRDLNINGDMTVALDMKYNGGLAITLLAVAKLDLGTRFKTRTVDLVLKTSVHRISGTMLLHIKPPPSNRMWFCFETVPDMDVRVEPVVSERKITYGFVLRAIEERIRTAVTEGLVKPNWDDVPFPFTDTRGSHARGGVWSYQGLPDGETSHQEQKLAERSAKTMSMSALPPEMDAGVSTSLYSNSEVNLAKLRHSATMPVDADVAGQASKSTLELGSSPERVPRPPRPLRTSSVTSTTPVVGMDDKNVEPVRADDASLKPSPTQGRTIWRSRASMIPQQSPKDALGELRGLRDRAEQAATKTTLPSEKVDSGQRTSYESDSQDLTSIDDDELGGLATSGTSTKVPSTPRSFSLRSSESERSSADSSIGTSRSEQMQQKKANILAATVSATNAARNWGWSAIQRNKSSIPRISRPSDSTEPMGRGQPLPPPGQPLPGPQKPIWPNMGTLRRKPIPNLPPRRAKPDVIGSSSTSLTKDESEVREHEGSTEESLMGEDEFEPFQANPGSMEPSDTTEDGPTNASSDDLDLSKSSTLQTHYQHSKAAPEDDTRSKQVAPPLPLRANQRTRIASISNPSYPASLDPEIDAASLESASKEDIADAPALRVPDIAANSIAAENSTPDLARGATDDTSHIAKDEGVDAELPEDAGRKGEDVFARVEEVGEKSAGSGEAESIGHLETRMKRSEKNEEEGLS